MIEILVVAILVITILIILRDFINNKYRINNKYLCVKCRRVRFGNGFWYREFLFKKPEMSSDMCGKCYKIQMKLYK